MPRLPTPITEAISDLRSYATNPKLADEIQADLEELIAAAIAPPSPVESGPAASPAPAPAPSAEPPLPCTLCGQDLSDDHTHSPELVDRLFLGANPPASAEPGSDRRDPTAYYCTKCGRECSVQGHPTCPPRPGSESAEPGSEGSVVDDPMAVGMPPGGR